MFYYQIVVASRTKSAEDVFTYCYGQKVALGSIVSVELRTKLCSGIVVEQSTKPSYETKLITTIVPAPPLPATHVLLIKDLIRSHPFSAHQVAQLFVPPATKLYGEPAKQPATGRAMVLPPLNQDQQKIIDSISSDQLKYLLYGETGSGKTRIYLHLAEQALLKGKSVVVLVPEIGLSGFIFDQFRDFFPNVYQYHSGMTKKTRQIIWQKCSTSIEPLVIIGPRSALTLPLKNIGLIVLDEAHDSSYKQDNAPYIRTHSVAVKLAELSRAFYIYATATPNVTDYYNAQLRGAPILRLTTSAVGSLAQKSHPVHCIDYSNTAEFSSSTLIANSALASIKQSIKKGHQSLILLNKRGTAHHIHCSDCTWELVCSRCDRGLVYHKDTHRAHCHTCGTQLKMPAHCPDCRGDITLRSPGTKSVVEYLQKTLPGVTIARFDTDTPAKESIDGRLGELQSGIIQCIVGTQMVAKGLDLPLLETIVVLHAEGSSGGDFAAEERAYQLIHQVVGRGTRGHRDTSIYLQSRNPTHHTLLYALKQDSEAFMAHELSERKKYNYPPYTFMAVIHYKRKTSTGAKQAGADFVAKHTSSRVELSGPLPDVFERRGPFYHWHILAKSSHKKYLVELARQAGSAWSCDLDPIATP